MGDDRAGYRTSKNNGWFGSGCRLRDTFDWAWVRVRSRLSAWCLLSSLTQHHICIRIYRAVREYSVVIAIAKLFAIVWPKVISTRRCNNIHLALLVWCMRLHSHLTESRKQLAHGARETPEAYHQRWLVHLLNHSSISGLSFFVIIGSVYFMLGPLSPHSHSRRALTII